MAKVNTFFISEKIAKIRWVPECLSGRGALNEERRFVTGSWDMRSNYVRVWRMQRSQYADDYNEFVPRCSDKVAFESDITGLEFVTEDYVAASCTAGRISLMKLQRAVDEDVLTLQKSSDILHKIEGIDKSMPCTALAVCAKEIATIGEDGRLNIIDTGMLQIRRCIDVASSVALTAVAYINTQEVLTANRLGVISLYDVRVSTTTPTTPTVTFMTACEDEKISNYVSCLTSHPTQQHIVLAGSEEGSITVWDLRQPGFPFSYLSAHESTITEIAFHRTEPTKLFTTSEDGELWLWTQNATIGGGVQSNDGSLETQSYNNDTMNPWLSGERAKNRITVTSLITDIRKPMNSFDASGSQVICGSDSEAIYFVDNVI